MADYIKDYSYSLPNAYIYLYHTDEYLIIPQFPENISDSLRSTFSDQNALSRTAPVFSYSNSGPRVVHFSLNLHRDMMNSFNVSGSNVRLNSSDSPQDIITNITDDYVDILIKKLQSIALPRYYADRNDKSVVPPRVAVRFGEEIFVKGIVQGGVNIEYSLPLLSNGKYARVSISFDIYETTPYDADSVGRLGSFRGLTSGLRATIENAQNGSGRNE